VGKCRTDADVRDGGVFFSVEKYPRGIDAVARDNDVLRDVHVYGRRAHPAAELVSAAHDVAQLVRVPEQPFRPGHIALTHEGAFCRGAPGDAVDLDGRWDIPAHAVPAAVAGELFSGALAPVAEAEIVSHDEVLRSELRAQRVEEAAPVHAHDFL